MIEFDTQIIPTARAMSFLFSGRVQLSKCAKNCGLPRRCVSLDTAGCARVGADGCRGLARGRAPADSGRFRRKWAPISPWSWTSVRFSAGVVRCWLCRPGETPMLGGVSGRFALRNRPEVCRWGLLGLKVAHEDVQFRRGRGDAERVGAFAECGDRNTSIG